MIKKVQLIPQDALQEILTDSLGCTVSCSLHLKGACPESLVCFWLKIAGIRSNKLII